uniref:ATP synthase F0 subunit 8 n=1 Tax=Salina celebensis TaxID=1588069 RepID=A0A6G6A4E4_9HEXA|nr:ATP synthase F0 subunit 8 [Salina celebensis]QID03176.1 ATP synthase F0 subunit 8 [Salina celebensis]
MSPLMWAPLFISFSTLLLFAMIKIYFKPGSTLSSLKSETNSITNPVKLDNPWMW